MKRFLQQVFVLFILTLCAPLNMAHSADTSLGIGLTIIPISDGSKANLSFNNQLWFGIEQGKSFTRQFQVSSASNISQRLEFELFDVLYDNGARTIRTDRPSLTSKWVTFSPAQVVIAPRGSAMVKMTYTIPADLKDSSYESFLRVNASAASLPKQSPSANGGVKVILPGSAAIDTPVWLGVGDPESLISDFEIKKVFGVLIDGEKKLRVVIENTGKTPLGLNGSVQLTDAAFSDRTFGPFGYRSSEVKPDSEAAIDIEMPADVSEGKWNIYVVAEQGNIRKSKVFSEEITFKPLSSSNLVQILLGSLALILLLVGFRLFRTAKPKSKPDLPRVNKAELLKRQEQNEKLIAELMTKIKVEDFEPSKRNSTSKKTTPKKITTAKKIAPKKPVKKAVARKPVKKATKKATAKKPSPAKKVKKK